MKSHVLWVGSGHRFKGGEVFDRVIKKSRMLGMMLFGGDVPAWAKNSSNIQIKKNLKREEVFEEMNRSSCYV